MEDGISGGLQHCHEMCCEKGGHRGRWACMVWRWFHYGDVISGQVDLYMTTVRGLSTPMPTLIFGNNYVKLVTPALLTLISMLKNTGFISATFVCKL